MVSYSQGKLRLENKVVDFANFEIRPKATESDLERYYDSFLSHAGEIADYFEDKAAFSTALEEAAHGKRPKLVPRETKYPFMGLSPAFQTYFAKPSERRLDDRYFTCAHCLTAIPKKVKSAGSGKPLDERLRNDISEKFENHPGYEGVIEVPDDEIPAKTKSTIFHESLHYLILRYLAETGRDFNGIVKDKLPKIEDYVKELVVHEGVADALTDKLLAHDPDAQFEERWLHYSLYDSFRLLVTAPSSILTGVLIGFSFAKPYLLPLALIPGRLSNLALILHKKSKKAELLKPQEDPKLKFKI